MSYNNFGISENTTELLKQIFQQYNAIEKVEIFGSRAKGNFREGSDIDLVIFASHFSEGELLSLKVKADDLNLLYKIDILIYDKIDVPELKAHIDRVGKIFYSKG